MAALRNELAKLRGSLVWAQVLLLPLVMVAAGVFTSLVTGTPLQDGWDTLWLRSVVFYGLLPYPLAVAVLAALVWRPEHRGGSWDALMSTTQSATSVVLAKTATVALLCAATQGVMLVAVLLAGTLLGLPGGLPGSYVIASGVLVLASLPLAASQSGLAMVSRSFAAPVTLALLASAASMALLSADVAAAAWVLPHALVARTSQLGTGTFLDDGTVDVADVAPVLAATLLLSLLVLACSSQVLQRRDARA